MKPLPAPRFPFVKGRLPPTLPRCPGCGLHLYAQARTCPHCGGSMAVLRRKQLKALQRAQAAVERLQAIFARSAR